MVKETLEGLQYIADSPAAEHGGFHIETIKTAVDAIAQIRQLESERDKLRTAIERANDIRGFGWHILRRRENDRMEWLTSNANEPDHVYGPFESVTEAFAALTK